MNAPAPVPTPPKPSTWALHNSDRALFLRCRRRFRWESDPPLGMGLQPQGPPPAPLWFGSGFHFAVEDFHGHHRFPRPAQAFEAYHNAFLPEERPVNSHELLRLAAAMLDYYVDTWLP